MGNSSTYIYIVSRLQSMDNLHLNWMGTNIIIFSPKFTHSLDIAYQNKPTANPFKLKAYKHYYHN